MIGAEKGSTAEYVAKAETQKKAFGTSEEKIEGLEERPERHL